MDIETYIDHVRTNGEALVTAGRIAGLNAAVPSCPGWTVADVLRHVGKVHRWAASFVEHARPDPVTSKEYAAITGPLPDREDGLFDYYADGLRLVVSTLAAAPADVECWHFLEAPSPLVFWARRQAHETAIHRTDVELAGGTVPVFDPAFAADGVDELLTGFLGDPRRPSRFDTSATIGVHATDTDNHWHLDITPGHLVATRQQRPADLTITGDAGHLYLLLWNRTEPGTVQLDGDTHLYDVWRRCARIG